MVSTKSVIVCHRLGCHQPRMPNRPSLGNAVCRRLGDHSKNGERSAKPTSKLAVKSGTKRNEDECEKDSINDQREDKTKRKINIKDTGGATLSEVEDFVNWKYYG